MCVFFYVLSFMIRKNINNILQFRYVRTQSLKNKRVIEKNVLHKMQHKVFTFTILTSTFQIVHRSYIFFNY